MIPKMTQGCTRVIGRVQGFVGLAVRDEEIEILPGSGSVVPVMTSSWELTPDEMARVANGAPVILKVAGTVHPPVFLMVGEVP